MIRSFVFVIAFVVGLTLSMTWSARSVSAQGFATWNASDAHPDMVLSPDLLTASSSNASSGWVAVRSTLSGSSGQWYWETKHVFSGSADVVVGVARAPFDLATRPGSDQDVDVVGAMFTMLAYAGPDRLGECRVNSMVAATTLPLSSGAIVRHWLNLDAGSYQVAVENGPWVSVITPDQLGPGAYYYGFGGDAWFVVAGLSQPAGSAASVIANFGATPFSYDVPKGSAGGVVRSERIFGSSFDWAIDELDLIAWPAGEPRAA